MPSLYEYRQRFGGFVTSGQAKKYESDLIMENTWWDDIQSKVAYIYDYYHDDEPLKLKDQKPQHTQKMHVDIKFIVNAYNSEARDQVGYHIQFRPGHKCPLSYYKEVFEEKYGAEYPVGLYIDIPDEEGNYRKWLVTERANQLGNQFPTYYVLPCDHIFQWIYEGKKYQLAGVFRSQNSYNSGVWLAYKIERIENQKKCILPMNALSATIFYNQRIALSADIKEPVVWRCTKVEQISPKGINKLTFAQDVWDQNHDYVERDEDGKLIGMWCNYYSTEGVPSFVPEQDDRPQIHSVIKYSGIKPQIKSGGSYKKFTVSFFDGETEIEPIEGAWSYSIDGGDVADKLLVITSDDDSSLAANQIKLKLRKDDTLIGKILTVSHVADGDISSSVDVEIVGL